MITGHPGPLRDTPRDTGLAVGTRGGTSTGPIVVFEGGSGLLSFTEVCTGSQGAPVLVVKPSGTDPFQKQNEKHLSGVSLSEESFFRVKGHE